MLECRDGAGLKSAGTGSGRALECRDGAELRSAGTGPGFGVPGQGWTFRVPRQGRAFRMPGKVGLESGHVKAQKIIDERNY